MHGSCSIPAALALIATAAVGGARGAEAWIEAEPTRPAPATSVAVRVVAAERFGPDASRLARPPASFQRLWNHGRAGLGGASEARFSASEPGVELIAYRSTTATRGPSISTNADFCKALLVVGDVADGRKIWRSELGHRLEILPETDPVRLLDRGGSLSVQVLFDREPLSGASVVAMPQAAPEAGYRSGVTDPAGRIRFDLDRPGPWIVHLMHKSACSACDPSGWEILSASLFLVAGPSRPGAQP